MKTYEPIETLSKPKGWVKIQLSAGEYLKNTAGDDAIITPKEAIDRRFRGDYTPVPVGDCYKPGAKLPGQETEG